MGHWHPRSLIWVVSMVDHCITCMKYTIKLLCTRFAVIWVEEWQILRCSTSCSAAWSLQQFVNCKLMGVWMNTYKCIVSHHFNWKADTCTMNPTLWQGGRTSVSDFLLYLSGCTMPSFNFSVSLKFVTASYIIFSLSMVQALEIFMITQQDVTKPRESNILKQGIAFPS